MTINNIVSGFCSAGIYPFAPKMILDKFYKPSQATDQSKDKDNDPPEDSASTDLEINTKNCLTSDSTSYSLMPETIKLYERRLENGYDVYTDMNYVACFILTIFLPWYVVAFLNIDSMHIGVLFIFL